MKKKKSNFFSNLLLILFVGAVICCCYLVVNKFTNKNENEVPKEVKSPLLDYGYKEEEISILNNNLTNDELKRIDKYYEHLTDFSKSKYFKMDYIERYENLKSSSEYDYEEIVMRVNMNLDYDFYENITEIENPDDVLVLCNKYYHLPDGFVPNDLVDITDNVQLSAKAASHYNEMIEAARNDGVYIYSLSGYRSESLQASLWNRYAARDGADEADTYSARPGHSEHQTGLAMDVTNAAWINDESFEDTPQFDWISVNAHKYGFIMRYPKGKEYITGYVYEPWHYRYVGVDVATIIYNEGITLEEYYVKYMATYDE